MTTTASRVWKWVRFGCLCCVVVVVFACAGLVVAVRNYPRSCPERELIRPGMTKDEVRATIGAPKEETERPNGSWRYYECGPYSTSAPIGVLFDKDGRVEYAYIID